MAEGETVRFVCLNDSNYAEWAVCMQAILVRRGLLSQIVNIVVDETGKDAATIAAEVEDLKKKRDAGKMDEACAEMVLRVEDGQLSHMHSGDPMEVWRTLRHVHLAAGFATSLALRRKFLTAKKSAAQSMQAWIGHIQSLAFRMEEAGIEVADQDWILVLTMGLPDSYDPVIINFDSTASELLMLNHVIARLLNEEARQSSHSATTNREDSHDEALAAVQKNRSRPRATGGNASADIICYFCDEKGHYKSECPARREWEKAKAKKIKGVAAAAWDSESDSDFESTGAF
jgi:gag-polypeptide of LTR copia-type/Zinc knuckle